MEYRWGLLETNLPYRRRPLLGEHIGETTERAQTIDGEATFQTEVDFRASRDLNPWVETLTALEDQPIDLDDYLTDHREKLSELAQRW